MPFCCKQSRAGAGELLLGLEEAGDGASVHGWVAHSMSASLLQPTASSCEGAGLHCITPQDFSILGLPQDLRHRPRISLAWAMSLSKAVALFWKFGHF